jgi:uncharacterized protein (TIGR01732 family)
MGAVCGTPFMTSTATILVLFILLVIISRVIGFGGVVVHLNGKELNIENRR